MYVIDVIPFSKGAPAGSLSYRSVEALSEGTLVSAPLRKRRVRGLVVGSIDVREAKASLKTANFALSGDVEVVGTLPTPIIEAVRATALYHATSLGAAFSQLLESVLTDDLPPELSSGSGFVRANSEGRRDVRIEAYRASASKTTGATLLVVPTLAEAATFKEALKDLKPLVLSSAVPRAKRIEAFKKAEESTGLIIATPAFSYVPIRSLTGIIVERASAGTYRFPKRPYLHTVHALEALAQARQISYTLGDFPLPIEYRENVSLSSDGLGTLNVFDAKEASEEQGAVFQAVPETLRTVIKETLIEGGHVAVLAARRGYAPAVVCRTCGASVRDAQGRGLSLATEDGVRIFRSSDGSVVQEADAVCDVCGSWNLMPLGVGVERVEEELKETFPDAHIIRFDTDTIRTSAQARKAIAEFEPGSILVGTEVLLPWLPDIELACIASADSLLALPFWRSRERFLRLLLTLRDRAKHTIVSTRRMDDVALESARDPEHGTFFEEEGGLRKILGYPPFGTLISVASVGTRTQLDALHEEIQRIAESTTFTRLPDRNLGDHRYRGSWVLCLAKGAWPNTALSLRLAALPLYIRVLLDPDSI